MSMSIPLPGQHRPRDGGENLSVGDPAGAVDPGAVEAEVDQLLARLPGIEPGSGDLNVHAQILERAHDVLVHALSAVDKS